MASSEQVVKLKCSVCDDNIAKVYCYECEHYLCQHCQHFHQKFPATKLHAVANAHQVDRNALKNKVICNEHGREYAFICQTCKTLICSVCVINKHHGHEFKGIAETATEARITTKRKVTVFQDQVNKLESLINERKSTERNKIRADSENYKAKVKEIATDFTKIVETVSKMYITKASDFHDLESEKLQENVKILQTLSDEQTSQCRKIEDFLTIEHDAVFFLNISEENITSELEEIPTMEDTRSMEDFDTEEFIQAILEQIKIKYNPKCLDSRQSVIDRLLEIQQSKETEFIALSRVHEIEVAKLKWSIDDANNKLLRFKDLEEDKNTLKREKEDALLKLKASKETMDALKKEKEDALNRRSAVMGDKLRDSNPAITNPNDPHRPMKIADQFVDLFDNEWTDALENLTDSKKLPENEAIYILLTITKEIYEVSREEVSKQLADHKSKMDGCSDEEIAEYIKVVRESIKLQAPAYVPLLIRKITCDMTNCPKTEKYKEYSLPFIKSCVTICYFAAVQSPQFYFDFEPQETVDKSFFRAYAKSGSKLDFLVWPAVFLHNGGPILCKGVVQLM